MARCRADRWIAQPPDQEELVVYGPCWPNDGTSTLSNIAVVIGALRKRVRRAAGSIRGAAAVAPTQVSTRRKKGLVLMILAVQLILLVLLLGPPEGGERGAS